MLEVGGALGFDHRPWNAQPDASVDCWAVLAVLDGDLVAEERRCFCPAVSDHGLVLVQFQFEVVTQELDEAGFDLFGFGLGSGEPEEMVVGVSDVMQTPVPWILWILAG